MKYTQYEKMLRAWIKIEINSCYGIPKLKPIEYSKSTHDKIIKEGIKIIKDLKL